MINYPHQISKLLDEYCALVNKTKGNLEKFMDGDDNTEGQKQKERDSTERQIRQYKNQYEILIHKRLEEVDRNTENTSTQWLVENKNMISKTLQAAIDQ